MSAQVSYMLPKNELKQTDVLSNQACHGNVQNFLALRLDHLGFRQYR